MKIFYNIIRKHRIAYESFIKEQQYLNHIYTYSNIILFGRIRPSQGHLFELIIDPNVPLENQIIQKLNFGNEIINFSRIFPPSTSQKEVYNFSAIRYFFFTKITLDYFL